jgi:AcrR family transcriptional regulator
VVGEPISRASMRSSAQRAPTTLLSEGQAGSGPRQRLLRAMVSVVARRGYQQSTVKDVISQARCSRSTFYAHFADMEDCLGALLSVLTDELFGEVQSAVELAPPVDAPKAAARTLLDFAREHGAPARVLFCESLAGGARAMDRRDALIDEIAGLVESRLGSQAKDAATFDLPASAAIGTVFRLLANRMRRGASGLHELEEGVLAWLDAYATADPHRHSRDLQALGEQGGLPRIRLTPATPPPPVRVGSHGASVSDRSRNQRERILFACAQCCYERGYVQMGIADIVSAAAVSRSVFYEHFHDKQHAALAVLEQAFELMMTTSARAYFAQDSWPERVWAAARALCEGYATHPAQFSCCFVEYAPMGPPAVQLEHDRLMAFTLMLEDGYRQRAEAEHLPRVVSELIVSLLMEYPYREIRRGKPPDRFYDLVPPQTYAAIAPFIGPAQASSFVQTKVEELKTEG